MLDHLISMLMDGVLPTKDQVEEAFGFSTHSETVCAVCKLAIPSLEASWKPYSGCDHAICIPCFWQYAPEIEATDGLPRCAVPSCESLCIPDMRQGINEDHTTLISTADINSGKGKEPLDGVLLQELGQCSRGANAMPSTNSDFYCAICMETMHVRELFPVSGCTHLFCVSCMSQYITTKVENNVFSIGCPESGCNDGVLDPEVCRDMISSRLFQRWGDALCDSALGAFGFYCPFEDCSALLVNERGPNEAVIRNTECPHCSRMFCMQCKVAWHYGVTCEDFQHLRNNEQGRDDRLPRKVVHEHQCQRSQQLRNDEHGRDDSLLVKVVHENKLQRSRRCLVATCKSLWKSEANRMIDVGHSTMVSTEDMDRQKQKETLDSMLQELSQCCPGGSAIASSEFYCTICMESVDVRELFPIPGCTHLFCVSCVSQYITAKVEENVLSIGCPEPGCKDGALDPEVCRDVIPLQLFQRWGAALCDSALGAFKFYCPFNDCSALLVDERHHGEAATITQVECPHCCRMFCAQCKVAWHDGITCAEFQRLGKDERSRDDLLLRRVAQRSKWQRCPKCKMYVEGTEGCVYIYCRCGHRFCYLCASPMARGIHRCSRCKRTW